MDVTNAQRQARYRARRAAAGVVQVQVFVHASRRDEIRQLADEMQGPRGRPGRKRPD
jgi:hypothetical protein